MGSILIVNASSVVRVGLRTILNEAGIRAPTLEARNAQETRAHMHATLDLAIIDPGMPGINPLLLVQRLHKLSPGVPILFFSDRNTALFASLAIKLGADGYIDQSSEESTIAAAIHTVLGGMQCFPRSPTDDQLSGRLQTLSQKELTVLLLLRQGLRNIDIAEKLYLSEKTISAHKRNILLKLDIRTIADIVEHESLGNIPHNLPPSALPAIL